MPGPDGARGDGGQGRDLSGLRQAGHGGCSNRVEVLADRNEPAGGEAKRPFESLLALPEIISQAVGVGPASKKVAGIYLEMLDRLGPELEILRRIEKERIEEAAGPVIAEGVARVREGQVEALGGYDGEFGKLSLFTPDELAEINRQGRLFKIGPVPKKEPLPPPSDPKPRPGAFGLFPEMEPLPPKFRPDPDQEAAVMAGPGPVMVLAGPGGGKTGVLVRRTERLLGNGSFRGRVLVLTFTRKAAQELKERLSAKHLKAEVETFHSWA